MQPIRDYWTTPNIFPESKSVIQRCNITTSIVANADDEFIYPALKHQDLCFPHVITSESCRSYKPRADIFLNALDVFGLSREEVLYVGGSYANDVLGAKALRIPVLYINRKKQGAP
jgi:FMN phosphatase YigB (HAD superfamily)